MKNIGVLVTEDDIKENPAAQAKLEQRARASFRRVLRELPEIDSETPLPVILHYPPRKSYFRWHIHPPNYRKVIQIFKGIKTGEYELIKLIDETLIADQIEQLNDRGGISLAHVNARPY